MAVSTDAIDSGSSPFSPASVDFGLESVYV